MCQCDIHYSTASPTHKHTPVIIVYTCVEENPPLALRCATIHLAIGRLIDRFLRWQYVSRTYEVISMLTALACSYGGCQLPITSSSVAAAGFSQCFMPAAKDTWMCVVPILGSHHYCYSLSN